MEIFCVISNKKHAGKTYISSHIAASLKMFDKKVCYYKPFIMEVRDNKLFDAEYIKNTANFLIPFCCQIPNKKASISAYDVFQSADNRAVLYRFWLQRRFNGAQRSSQAAFNGNRRKRR